MSETVAGKVFNAVMTHGALTARRIIRECGPKPNWEYLVHTGYLKVVHTPYGMVVGATPKGHQFVQETWKRKMPYVASAGHMADRAYLLDALSIVEAQGYTLHHHIYKKAGKVGTAARSGQPVTDQIIRTVVSVPEEELRRLRAIYWMDAERHPLALDRIGRWSEAVGHPSLYATVSNGGITPNRLKDLLKRHKNHLDIWHTPLIIVTPNEPLLRPLVRSINGRYKHKHETINKKHDIKGLPIHDLVTLIDLPLPQTRKPA